MTPPEQPRPPFPPFDADTAAKKVRAVVQFLQRKWNHELEYRC